jgi:hypothetical protein
MQMKAYIHFEPATGAIHHVINSTSYEQPPGDGVLVLDQPVRLEDHSDWRVLNGELVRVSIDSTRREAISEINATVGSFRERFITTAPGQEMIYSAKEAEARSFILNQPEALEEYPFIAAEVGILAPTAWQVAQIWLYMGASWRSIAANLEGLRVAATSAVAAAQSVEDIQTILANFKGALP